MILKKNGNEYVLFDGAWIHFQHFNVRDSGLWRKELAKMSDIDWKKTIYDMAAIGLKYIVIQDVFITNAHYGDRKARKGIEKYKGAAFYPSRIFRRRAKIAATDPLGAVLEAATEKDMKVFIGLGNYAWFDYGPDALKWALMVGREITDFYGDYPSFYGWYISQEMHGNAAPQNIHRVKGEAEKEKVIKNYRREIINYLRELRTHFSEDIKGGPILLAPNCHYSDKAADFYPILAEYIDILCPFGFNRMPGDDVDAPKRIDQLRTYLGNKAELWWDYEIFLFNKKGNLIPKDFGTVKEEISELGKYFDRILFYDYTGLMNSPGAAIKPGGPATVKLYIDYKKYYRGATRHNDI